MKKRTEKPTDERKPRIRATLQVESAELILGNSTHSLVGIPSHVYTRLALEGLRSLLARSKDKSAIWQSVLDGSYGTVKRSYQPIIHAISKIVEQPESEVFKVWKTLDKSARRLYRTDPHIQSLIAQSKIDAIVNGKDDSAIADFSQFEKKSSDL